MGYLVVDYIFMDSEMMIHSERVWRGREYGRCWEHLWSWQASFYSPSEIF